LSAATEKATILLIEDNLDNREVYRLVLEYRGHRVLTAVDGETGLVTARSALPDLVVMDVSMPGISGWEVARLLKEDASTAGIPIVAVTALAMPKDRAKAEELALAGYFPKPIEPMRLADEVERILARERSAAE
jgi:CheY-like chemotaxis protein